MDWHVDAARDWSLTAWGTLGNVEVAYTGDGYENKESDHMPQITDDNRVYPVTPIEVEATTNYCQSTDNGAVDMDGDGCAVYQWDWCKKNGAWDTDDFIANEMCCVCGGGDKDGDDEEEKEDDKEDEDGDDQEEYTDGCYENFTNGNDTGTCCNTNNGIVDGYGDTCQTWYDATPTDCLE